MKLTHTVAAMAALIFAPHANAADVSRVQMLDAQIADAKRAKTALSNANGRICYDAGEAMGRGDPNASVQFNKCMDATRAEMDASGLVGYLYEQRSHLTGEPMPSEYACNGNLVSGRRIRTPRAITRCAQRTRCCSGASI